MREYSIQLGIFQLNWIGGMDEEIRMRKRKQQERKRMTEKKGQMNYGQMEYADKQTQKHSATTLHRLNFADYFPYFSVIIVITNVVTATITTITTTVTADAWGVVVELQDK